MVWKDLFPKENRYFESENGILYQGDCLEIMKIFPKESIDLIITDPPYGMTRNKWDIPINLNTMWKFIKKIRKERTPTLLFAQCPFDKILGYSNIKELKYEWIWQKEQGSGHLNANRMPLRIHENILVFYKKSPLYKPQKIGNEKRIIKRSGK